MAGHPGLGSSHATPLGNLYSTQVTCLWWILLKLLSCYCHGEVAAAEAIAKSRERQTQKLWWCWLGNLSIEGSAVVLETVQSGIQFLNDLFQFLYLPQFLHVVLVIRVLHSCQFHAQRFYLFLTLSIFLLQHSYLRVLFCQLPFILLSHWVKLPIFQTGLPGE